MSRSGSRARPLSGEASKVYKLLNQENTQTSF